MFLIVSCKYTEGAYKRAKDSSLRVKIPIKLIRADELIEQVNQAKQDDEKFLGQLHSFKSSFAP